MNFQQKFKPPKKLFKSKAVVEASHSLSTLTLSRSAWHLEFNLMKQIQHIPMLLPDFVQTRMFMQVDQHKGTKVTCEGLISKRHDQPHVESKFSLESWLPDQLGDLHEIYSPFELIFEAFNPGRRMRVSYCYCINLLRMLNLSRVSISGNTRLKL